MTIRRLEPQEWRGFCLRVTKTQVGKRAELQVASLQLGAQIGARRAPLLGISYDDRRDIFEIVLGDLDHIIRGPRALYVEEGADGLLSFEVIDGSGMQEIVTLYEPLLLPRPVAVL